MHEFPLVIFTLFMQGAVGFTLMLCLTAGQMPRAGDTRSPRCLRWFVWASPRRLVYSPRRCIWGIR